MKTSQSHGFLYQDNALIAMGYPCTQDNRSDRYDCPLESAPSSWIFPFPRCNGLIKTFMHGQLAMADALTYIDHPLEYFILAGEMEQFDKRYKKLVGQWAIYISQENHKKICGDNTRERAIELTELLRKFPKGMATECNDARNEWYKTHSEETSLFHLDGKISDSCFQRRVQANCLNLNKLINLVGSSNVVVIQPQSSHPLQQLYISLYQGGRRKVKRH